MDLGGRLVPVTGALQKPNKDVPKRKVTFPVLSEPTSLLRSNATCHRPEHYDRCPERILTPYCPLISLIDMNDSVRAEAVAPRTLVLCFDGTAGQFDDDVSVGGVYY